MTDAVEWLRTFIDNYPALQYMIVYLGSAFGGEVAMVALAFLAAQELFSFVPFVIVSFIGIYSSDILWFLMGRTAWAHKFFTHKYTHSTISLIVEAVKRISKGNHFIALLLANFMLASRVILIIYVAKSELTFKKFLFYEAIASILWLVVMIGIGYVSGLGYTYLGEVFQNIYAGFGFLLIIVFIIIMVQIWLKKKFTEEVK